MPNIACHAIIAALLLAAPAEALYYEDFESVADGGKPFHWLDTGPNNSMAPANLFAVRVLPNGNHVLSTTSTETNIHTHYVGEGADGWTSYEVSGRVWIGDAQSGVGIAFYSDYPNADIYLRLRREGGGSFKLEPHPDSECEGITDTGVIPEPETWYDFRIQVRRAEHEGPNLVLAKVSREGASVPMWCSPNCGWDAGCLDATTTYPGGTIGLWAMGPGEKQVDDLRVIAVDAPPIPPPPPPLPPDPDPITEPVRFTDPNPAPSPVVAVELYLDRNEGGVGGDPIDLGLPPQDTEGVYSTEVQAIPGWWKTLRARDIDGLKSGPSNSREVIPVPEPAGGLYAGLVLLVLLARRGRR